MKIKIYISLVALVFMPVSALAVSGTSYTIDPADNITSTHHSVSGATYSIDGSIDLWSGNPSSTNYTLESGDAARWLCGDGFIDPDEQCEGSNLNGATCVTLGYLSGTLSCSSACAYTTSNCVSPGGGGGGGGGAVTGKPTTPTVDSTYASTTSASGVEVPYYTYEDTVLLFGTMSSTTTSITVDGSSVGVTYPTTTTWNAQVTLTEGDNDFEIVAVNSRGSSSTYTITIHQRYMADINDDSTINDYDLSLLIQLWGDADKEGDFNTDGVIDDYDFSILVSRWS